MTVFMAPSSCGRTHLVYLRSDLTNPHNLWLKTSSGLGCYRLHLLWLCTVITQSEDWYSFYLFYSCHALWWQEARWDLEVISWSFSLYLALSHLRRLWCHTTNLWMSEVCRGHKVAQRSTTMRW